jgi:glutamate N-acetyltransferase/amino-acid N-acetyltransferase
MSPRVPGFRAGGISCGIKPSGAPDLALIASDRPAAAAGVFTRSHVPGAPIQVSRQRIRSGRASAIVVNSGISNVAGGPAGLRDARQMARLAAQGLGVPERSVLVFSTGISGRPLPMGAIARGIPRLVGGLSASGWRRAARAILTTDRRPKLALERLGDATLVGIAKGSGMIMPNMATMLGYLATDLAVEPRYLRGLLREVVDETFNCLTIDGEMSTSDAVILLANGAAGNRPIGPRSGRARHFERALLELCRELCEKLALDGEGVTRLADVIVRGARDKRRAARVARSIANSVLVKTALFGADPNWGRVVQAVGAAGVPLDPGQLGIHIGGVAFLRDGRPVGGEAALRRAARAMRRKRVAIEVTLGTGPGEAHLLTTDLSYEYVRINAEYTT